MKNFIIFTLIFFICFFHLQGHANWKADTQDWKVYAQLQTVTKHNAHFAIPLPMNILGQKELELHHIPGSSLNQGLGRGIDFVSLPRLYVQPNHYYPMETRVDLAMGYQPGGWFYRSSFESRMKHILFPREYRLQYADTAIYLNREGEGPRQKWELVQGDGKVYVFNDQHRLIAVRDQYGNTVEFFWERTPQKDPALEYAQDRLISVKTEDWQIQFRYDEQKNFLQSIDYHLPHHQPVRQLLFSYRGEFLKEVRWKGSERALFQAQYEEGFLTEQTLPWGGTLKYQYQSLNEAQSGRTYYFPKEIVKMEASTVVQKIAWEVSSFIFDQETQITHHDGQDEKKWVIELLKDNKSKTTKTVNGHVTFELEKEYKKSKGIHYAHEICTHRPQQKIKVCYIYEKHGGLLPTEYQIKYWLGDEKEDEEGNECTYSLKNFMNRTLLRVAKVDCFNDPHHNFTHKLSNTGEIQEYLNRHNRPVVAYQYDQKGRITLIDEKTTIKKTRYAYNQSGLFPTQTWINGRGAYSFRYDDLWGYPTWIKDYRNHEYHLKYSIDGQLQKITKTNSAGVTTPYFEVLEQSFLAGKWHQTYQLMGQKQVTTVSDFEKLKKNLLMRVMGGKNRL